MDNKTTVGASRAQRPAAPRPPVAAPTTSAAELQPTAPGHLVLEQAQTPDGPSLAPVRLHVASGPAPGKSVLEHMTPQDFERLRRTLPARQAKLLTVLSRTMRNKSLAADAEDEALHRMNGAAANLVRITGLQRTAAAMLPADARGTQTLAEVVAVQSMAEQAYAEALPLADKACRRRDWEQVRKQVIKEDLEEHAAQVKANFARDPHKHYYALAKVQLRLGKGAAAFETLRWGWLSGACGRSQFVSSGPWFLFHSRDSKRVHDECEELLRLCADKPLLCDDLHSVLGYARLLLDDDPQGASAALGKMRDKDARLEAMVASAMDDHAAWETAMDRYMDPRPAWSCLAGLLAVLAAQSSDASLRGRCVRMVLSIADKLIEDDQHGEILDLVQSPLMDGVRLLPGWQQRMDDFSAAWLATIPFDITLPPVGPRPAPTPRAA